MTLNNHLAFRPAWELAQLIKGKKVSPVELVDCLLQRIADLNPKLNAYLTVTEAEAFDCGLTPHLSEETEKVLAHYLLHIRLRVTPL